jgi:hypothetical protein
LHWLWILLWQQKESAPLLLNYSTWRVNRAPERFLITLLIDSMAKATSNSSCWIFVYSLSHCVVRLC